MSRNYFVIAVTIIALVGAAIIYWLDGRDDDPARFDLLSKEEIGSIDPASPATQAEKQRTLTLTDSRGPAITVSAPSGYSLVSPVDFDIRIEPKNGVAVDMKSLRIEYKLGPAWINLTNRIMKQATIKGSRLIARGADLPPGNHVLRLTAKDENAQTTRATVSFSVAK